MFALLFIVTGKGTIVTISLEHSVQVMSEASLILADLQSFRLSF